MHLNKLFFLLLVSLFSLVAKGQCVVAPVPNDACYNTTIANDSWCCDVEWDGICQSAYDDCIAAGGGGGGGGGGTSGDGCVSDVSICTPGAAGPFVFDQGTPGPPTDYADPVGCSTGLFGNDNGFGFILLEITTSGPLNLLVNGSSNDGFIDVIVYDIPDGVNPCEAVMNSANEIGCNYATDLVGCTQFGNDFGCTSSIPAPNVVAGQTLMIIVHDYSTASNSFTLELGPTGAQTGPPDATIDQVLSACLSDGSFQMTAASMGGTWTGPGISSDGIFDPLAAGIGSHTINYTIGNAPCIDDDVTTINVVDCTVPCSISYSQPEYCADETDPTPTLIGDAGGTYSSSPGLVINAATGVIDLSASTPGNYTISYTPPGGSSCGVVNSVSVQVNALPTIIASNDLTICNGESTTISVSGGSTYSWDNGLGGGSSHLVSPSSTTTYNVTGTSAEGCESSDAVTITVSAIPVVIASSDESICNGESVTVSASGASTYSWNNGLGIGSSHSVTPSTSTTYTVAGTNLDGCEASDYVIITVNNIPTITASDDLTICNGEPTTISVSGGSTYSWDNGLGGGSSHPVSPSSTTTYNVTGTSAAGCESSDAVTITVSTIPVVIASSDESTCNGESVTVSASGASTYSWNNGLGIGSSHSVTPSTTTTYTVTGTNLNGCEASDYVIITVNNIPTITASDDITICNGESTTISVSGGSTYSWDNGLGGGSSHVVSPSATTTYNVTGTSAEGCESSDAVTVTVAGSITITASSDTTICEGTSTTISVAGAATYSWDNSLGGGSSHIVSPLVTTTYSVTGTSASGCEGTDMVTVSISNNPIVFAGNDETICQETSIILSGSGATTYSWTGGVVDGAGFTPSVGVNTFTLTGTNDIGCEGTDYISIEVVANPTPSIIGEPQYCTGTSTVLGVDNSFISYNWSNGSVANQINADESLNPITVTVIDNNGCQGTSQEFFTEEVSGITTSATIEICEGDSAVIHGTTQTIDGVYSQTFPSASGCDSVSTITLIVHTLPIVNAGLDQTLCENESTSVSASGATIYSWSGGLTDGSTFYPPLGPTTYTVVGTDDFGCENQDDIEIVVNPLPTVNAGEDQTICDGVSTILQGSGADAYTWDNGVVDNVSFTPSLTTTYNVVGTDLNGCENSDNVQITIIEAPTVYAGMDESLCEGESYYFNATGAESYTWSSGDVNQTSVILANGINNFTVTGTDAYGCESNDDLIVTINALPNVYAGQDVVICEGESTILLATGASTYAWSNGTTNGESITPPIGINTYSVTGTSSQGCINIDDVEIEVAPNPIADAGNDITICEGELVTLNGQGGISGSNYTWNNGVTDGQPFIASNNTFILNVIDPNGCTDSDEMTITTIPAPIIEAGENQGGCDGDFFVISGSGAGTGGSYSWDNGVIDGVNFSAPIGTTIYTVTGTDQYGCTNTDELQINVEAYPTLTFYADVDGNCSPVNVVLYNTTSDPITNCVWDVVNGVTSTTCEAFSFTLTDDGLYDVTLSASSPVYGCLSTITYTELIQVDPVPNAQFDMQNQSVSTFNPTVYFGNESTDATTYEWNFGDGYFGEGFEPSHTYDEDPTHYLVQMVAFNDFGCSDTAYQYVEIEEELIFFIPNSFTPDQDEYNQWFQPVFYSGFDPYDFTMLIYNRWGEVIFETHDATRGWDGTYEGTGKLCQSGTYTWAIEFKSAMSDERMEFNGHLNLLR